MTPTEYKTLREKLALTQGGLASRLGVTRKTINARENGAKITEEAAAAIRAVRVPFADGVLFNVELRKLVRGKGSVLVDFGEPGVSMNCADAPAVRVTIGKHQLVMSVEAAQRLGDFLSDWREYDAFTTPQPEARPACQSP